MKNFVLSVILSAFIISLSACAANNDTKQKPAFTKEKTSEEAEITTAEASKDIFGEDAYSAFEGSWNYTQSADPLETVRSAIENQANKSYSERVEFITAQIDERETERYLETRVKEAGIGDSVIDEESGKTYNEVNIALVIAHYYAEYDGTKTPYTDGCLEQTFYLCQDKDAELWTIYDNTYPKSFGMEEWEGFISKEALSADERLPDPAEWKPQREGEIYTSSYWLYQPSDDPVQTVKSAIENQAKKEFTNAVSFKNALIDSEETEKYSRTRKGSEAAKRWNISDEMFDSGRIAAVYAEYNIEYAPLTTSVDGGDCGQYFYLWQDKETSFWHIFESSYNKTDYGQDIIWGR